MTPLNDKLKTYDPGRSIYIWHIRDDNGVLWNAIRAYLWLVCYSRVRTPAINALVRSLDEVG